MEASASSAADQQHILVTTEPLRRIVPPEHSLDAEAVAATGLDSVGEVIADIAAQQGERTDEAEYLVNGRRVSGLGAVSDLPAEAITRIDVHPRGAGISLGVSANRRVYNIQLRRNLDLGTGRLAARLATDGGWASRRAEASYTHIQGPRRLTLAAKARDESRLLESERAILQPAGLPAGAGAFRSLVPASDRLELSLAAADELAPWLSGTLNSRLSVSGRESFLGPFALAAAAPVALDQHVSSFSLTNDLNLNASYGAWQLGFFARYAWIRGRTATDIPGPIAPTPQVSRFDSHGLGAELSAFGPLVTLPAGPLSLNVTAGLSRDSIDSRRAFQGVSSRRETSLSGSSLSAALEVPIAGSGFLEPLGNLSASLSFSRHRASDFGSFSNYRLSTMWRPAAFVTFTASLTRNISPPPLVSRDEPAVETPGFRYFDPLRSETVDVTLITGGSMDLPRQTDEIRSFGFNLKPVRRLNFRVTSEFVEQRWRNALSEFPAASTPVFQAFPDRFVRDAAGRLVSVDVRPISFPNRVERQLRTNFLLDLPLGSGASGIGVALADPDQEDGPGGNRAPAAAGSVRPRIQVTVSHTWLLDSTLVLRAGQPAIDLLSREAVGLGGLGMPRHRVNAGIGYAETGLGARLSVQSRTASATSANGAANILRFHPLTTLSLRAWVTGERLAPNAGVLRNTRFTLNLTNATGRRERVTDSFGLTPLAYQRAYRDPIGRSVEFEIRRTF